MRKTESRHIATIYDSSFDALAAQGSSPVVETHTEGWRTRAAARCIIVRSGLIAMQSSDNGRIRKIPGGGVEEGETIRDAILREMAEEVGITGIDATTDIPEIGITIEYRGLRRLVQVSHIHAMDLPDTAQIGQPLEEASQLLWEDPRAVLMDFSTQRPPLSEGAAFILKREQAILSYYVDNVMG